VCASLAALLAAGALSCVTPTPEGKVREAERMAKKGQEDEARALLEKTAQEAPENLRVRLALANAYTDVFRRALSQGDEPRYVEYMEKAQAEALSALDLDPDSADAQTLLGIIAIYRGDIDAAAQSFNLSAQLDPTSWVSYLNVAELEIYRGNLARARRNIDLARRFGAPPGEVELVEVLCAWKLGDYVEARDIFDDVALLEPDRARTWNGATDISTFDDMAAHCCKLEFCGPYMQRACKEMDQIAAERKRTLETLKREIELEQERKKSVEQAYRNRRDIEIEVEDDK